MSPEIVLIENDELVRSHWERRCARAKKKIRTFRSCQEFYNSIRDFKHDANFFVDKNLGEALSGIELTKSLHNQGYRNIYLCTADTLINIKSIQWIKGVIGKLPPTWILSDNLTAPVCDRERQNQIKQMSQDQVTIYRARIGEFLNIVHGQDSGAFAGQVFSGFDIPELVMNAWERGITHSLSDEEIKRYVDHAWSLS